VRARARTRSTRTRAPTHSQPHTLTHSLLHTRTHTHTHTHTHAHTHTHSHTHTHTHTHTHASDLRPTFPFTCTRYGRVAATGYADVPPAGTADDGYLDVNERGGDQGEDLYEDGAGDDDF
jgi:hypothetical protein